MPPVVRLLLLLAASLALATPARAVTVGPSLTGQVQDDAPLGSPDSTGQIAGLVQSQHWNLSTQRMTHGIFEYNLSGVHGIVTAASLSVNVVSLGGAFDQSADFYAYVADGFLGFDDYAAGAFQGSQSGINIGVPASLSFEVPIDAAVANAALASTGALGINIRLPAPSPPNFNTINFSGTTTRLNLTVVPEPGSAALLCASLALLGAAVRRRA